MEKSLGDRLEKLRGDISQRAFANKIGVPLTSYTNWVLGISQPKFDNLRSICTILGVSADWLLGISDAASTPVVSTASVKIEGDASYWRDMAVSQQATISRLTTLLAEGRPAVVVPVQTGGRSVQKTA